MPVNTPHPPRLVRKGDPPEKAETRGNVSKPDPGQTVALNFRVPSTLKRDFKIASATHGITQSALLVEAFAEWQRKHGYVQAS
jgi:hypothetical protein